MHMKNLLKTVSISLLLPNLALGQPATLSTPGGDEGRHPPLSTPVAKSAPRLQQSSARAKTVALIRQHGFTLMGMISTVALGCYAFTLRSANQSLTETHRNTDAQLTRVNGLFANLQASYDTQVQAFTSLETTHSELQKQHGLLQTSQVELQETLIQSREELIQSREELIQYQERVELLAKKHADMIEDLKKRATKIAGLEKLKLDTEELARTLQDKETQLTNFITTHKLQIQFVERESNCFEIYFKKAVPDDVIMHVLAFLTPHDIISMRRINKATMKYVDGLLSKYPDLFFREFYQNLVGCEVFSPSFYGVTSLDKSLTNLSFG